MVVNVKEIKGEGIPVIKGRVHIVGDMASTSGARGQTHFQ